MQSTCAVAVMAGVIDTLHCQGAAPKTGVHRPKTAALIPPIASYYSVATLLATAQVLKESGV